MNKFITSSIPNYKTFLVFLDMLHLLSRQSGSARINEDGVLELLGFEQLPDSSEPSGFAEG